ncbi:MAG: acylneuraminate cytidylyltransferase family protein [bacterium]|nr:acylneuraminate cytidylyltransferase family protein [bacterium]
MSEQSKKNIRILGLITARGGSKGIPRKNIKDLCGKPLIAYTIEAARGSKLLTRTVVSTDSDEIARIARSFGADVPFMRPAELSGDKSTSLEAAQHALRELNTEGDEPYDYLMILQPTSPLRTSADIDAAIAIAAKTGTDSVMGMVELPDFSPKKLKTIKDGVIHPLLEDEGRMSAMRHDAPHVYKRNAAIYLTKTSLIMVNDLFGSDSRAYIMPWERSVDINSLSDFELAEYLLSKRTSA